MKTRILEALKKSTDFISGQELCEKCSVSRTAIWKVIKQLKNDGYEIESVQGKGYRLLRMEDVLSKEEIASELEKGGIVSLIHYFSEIDSTNNKAKLLGEEGAPDGTLVVADSQSFGKGRRGRSFESPKGQSIYMTLLLRPDIAPMKASMLTIVAAMAVRKGLYETCGIDSAIKWPNDIVAQNKKVCGILTEMSAEPDAVNYVVIGIGININNADMPEALKDVAVSVKMLTGISHKRSEIIAAVMKSFRYYYEKFLETEDLSQIKEEYNEGLIHMEREIEIIAGSRKYSAVSKGIDDDGELLIEREGHMEKVMSGEVSVRGIYGYV